jgi:hypothetical protein
MKFAFLCQTKVITNFDMINDLFEFLNKNYIDVLYHFINKNGNAQRQKKRLNCEKYLQ